jgi:uncharacterized protein
MLPAIEERLARELGARIAQVAAAIELLDDGASVPFIARYRKEATGGLDDTQLRLLDERLVYLRELEARRTAILASIDEERRLRWAWKSSVKLSLHLELRSCDEPAARARRGRGHPRLRRAT